MTYSVQQSWQLIAAQLGANDAFDFSSLGADAFELAGRGISASQLYLFDGLSFEPQITSCAVNSIITSWNDATLNANLFASPGELQGVEIFPGRDETAFCFLPALKRNFFTDDCSVPALHGAPCKYATDRKDQVRCGSKLPHLITLYTKSRYRRFHRLLKSMQKASI